MSESTTPMTKLEIIDFVINHYKTNRRSISRNGCLYNAPNGAMCAFAIMCANPKDLIEENNADDLIKEGIPKLKPEFAGQSNDFYSDIQELHDDSDNWDKTPEGNKLSQDGIKRVEWLKETYK